MDVCAGEEADNQLSQTLTVQDLYKQRSFAAIIRFSPDGIGQVSD
jgi:hypothetical protein